MPSKGLPIAALALGLVGLFTGGLLGLGSLVGLVLAIVALRRASREPGAYGGRDVAWAAVAANAFALVSLLPLAMFLVAMRPFLFPPDPGLPEPVPETQRVFEEPAPPRRHLRRLRPRRSPRRAPGRRRVSRAALAPGRRRPPTSSLPCAWEAASRSRARSST